VADQEQAVVTVTLSQAKTLIRTLAHEQSLLLLSPPGVGKSDAVAQAATAVGLPCRSLLGTQIAPEDVSGIPRIIGDRSVFCPPRILLPENPQPFCLFLDELPACAPDIQKAFYALLLERRLGEHALPKGTWVVAAGNRTTDRALVRNISSALINRVTVLHVRVDVQEWLVWARDNNVREEVRDFITAHPAMLIRPVPEKPEPFSTPRAWAALAAALDRAEADGILSNAIRRALARGRLSPDDATSFCRWVEGETSRRQREAEVQPLAQELFDWLVGLPKESLSSDRLITKALRHVRADCLLSLAYPLEARVAFHQAGQNLDDVHRGAFLSFVTAWLSQRGLSLAIETKIMAIKTVRDVVGGKTGLKETKDAVEAIMGMSAAERDRYLAEAVGV
jgi:MoxR-like ATPase